MRHFVHILTLALLTFATNSTLYSQEIAVRANALDYLFLSPNIGADYKVAPLWTVGLTINYQPFAPSSDRRFKHWDLRPEVHRWLDTPFMGHCLGAYLSGGRYNIGNIHFPPTLLKNRSRYRYEGWRIGAGVSYGYYWTLAPAWRIGASIDMGFAYYHYDRYLCKHCGNKIGTKEHRWYVGPTGVALSLIYLIKQEKK